MNTFVGNFSLPALIFISLCQLDLTIVNYTFLLAILVQNKTHLDLWETKMAGKVPFTRSISFSSSFKECRTQNKSFKYLKNHVSAGFPAQTFLVFFCSCRSLNRFSSLEFSSSLSQSLEQTGLKKLFCFINKFPSVLIAF